MTGSGLDLLVVVADSDTQRLIDALLRRGKQRGCLRDMAHEVVRDTRKDASVVRAPEASVRPRLPAPALHVLVLWDHEGSGREREPPAAVEADVVAMLTRVGLQAERTAAVAFVPEVEVAFAPVHRRVTEILGSKAKRSAATDAEVIARLDPELRAVSRERLLVERPKELFDATLAVLQQRHSPAHFEALGQQLSLPDLKKGDALGRIAERLVAWFPPEAGTE